MATALKAELRIGATNHVKLIGLVTDDGVYPLDAVVKVTLFDRDGVALPDATDIPLTYVGGTVGPTTEYRGTLPSTVALERGTIKAVCTATSGGSTGRMVRNIPVKE